MPWPTVPTGSGTGHREVPAPFDAAAVRLHAKSAPLSKLCLHDAALLTLVEHPGFAIIAVRQGRAEHGASVPRSLGRDQQDNTASAWSFAATRFTGFTTKSTPRTLGHAGSGIASCGAMARSWRFPWPMLAWSRESKASNQVEIPAPLADWPPYYTPRSVRVIAGVGRHPWTRVSFAGSPGRMHAEAWLAVMSPGRENYVIHVAASERELGSEGLKKQWANWLQAGHTIVALKDSPSLEVRYLQRLVAVGSGSFVLRGRTGSSDIEASSNRGFAIQCPRWCTSTRSGLSTTCC